MKHPFLLKLALYGWRTGLVLGAVTTALTLVFASPDALKSALDGSGAYDAASDTLANAAANKVTGVSAVLAKEDIDSAAKQAFSAQSLQSTTEGAIDGTYGWLQGRTDTPNISINTGSYASKFADTLALKATQRAGQGANADDNRPACTAEQLQHTVVGVETVDNGSTSLDTSHLACSPEKGVKQLVSGTVYGQAQQAGTSQLEDALRNNAIPLQASTASSADDGAGKNLVVDGRAVSDKLSYLRQVYTIGMLAPWVFGALAVISGIFVYLLTRGSGLSETARRLARSLLGSGIFLAVIAALSHLLTILLSKPGGSISHFVSNGYGHAFVAFVSALERRIDLTVFIFGLMYAAIAAGLLVYLKMRKPAKLATVPVAAAAQPAPEAGDIAAKGETRRIEIS